jgi:hypothetical protein
VLRAYRCAPRESVVLVGGQRLGWQVTDPSSSFASCRNEPTHFFEVAETEQTIVAFELAGVARVGNHGRVSMEGEHGDVFVSEAGLFDGLPDVFGFLSDEEFGDSVAGADGEALANVEFGEGDLIVDVIDNGTGDVEPRRCLDSLEAW